MTIGPEPMIRIEEMSVRFGIFVSRQQTKDDRRYVYRTWAQGELL